MKVRLLGYTTVPFRLLEQKPDGISPLEYVIAMAGRVSVSKKEDITKLTKEEVVKTIDSIMSMGHYSVIEHVSFTFLIEDISRVTAQQLTRHRIASYTMRSQRYINEKNADFVIPISILESEEASELYSSFLENSLEIYNKLVELKIPKEDARYVLPNATMTRLVMTVNLRELIHIFQLRMCAKAQWEIRELFSLIFGLIYPLIPHVMKHFQLNCSICKEKNRNPSKCAMINDYIRRVKEKYEDLSES